ncbi:ribbon-helix-helix domain-containing protein [Paraburkholderia sp. 32]|uniref:ribbon-helix-helix domain-containing protein n=1 Tax=Paraburkholderia sp. 32 TaxID=2991057 RepID=UPI003D246951
MPQGKYLGTDTRPLNVRVDADDLEVLKMLQLATGTNTSEVVRAALKDYIATHRHLLAQLGKAIAKEANGK